MKYKEEISDEELFLLLQSGDKKAFLTLYNRYWTDLIKKALHKLSDQVFTEEVVQNVFVNLWRWKANIVLKGEFKYYLYTMLRNEIFRYMAVQLRKSATVSFDEINSVRFISIDNDAHEQIEFNELQDKIKKLVDCLPNQCRLIFQLSREEGMTAKQIADQLHISHRTVETQLSKAIRTLKNAIRRIDILLYFQKYRQLFGRLANEFDKK